MFGYSGPRGYIPHSPDPSVLNDPSMGIWPIYCLLGFSEGMGCGPSLGFSWYLRYPAVTGLDLLPISKRRPGLAQQGEEGLVQSGDRERWRAGALQDQNEP